MSGHSDMEILALDAQNVLNSAAFNLAMARVKSALADKWVGGVLATAEEREAAYQTVQAAGQLEVELHAMLNDLKFYKQRQANKERRR